MKKRINIFGGLLEFEYDKAGFWIVDSKGYKNVVSFGLVNCQHEDMEILRFTFFRFQVVFGRRIKLVIE